MRICVLESSYEGSVSPFRGVDTFGDPAEYLFGHEHEIHRVRKATAEAQIAEMERRGFDVFVNLCDGARDEDRAGIEVVEALERLGLAFTGAGSAFYEPTRAEMKRACLAEGIPAPRGIHVRDPGAAREVLAQLRFPLIVKHPESYGSIGLTPDSRVTTRARLEAEIACAQAAFGGALVEEFIQGRELTVLVAEDPDDPRRPLSFVPLEYRFPPGETFKHFGLKWLTPGQLEAAPCRDEALCARVRDMSCRLFAAMGGTGYARCDVRVDEAGLPYMLEINPNCGVFCGDVAPGAADLILAHDPIGLRGFVDHILRSAHARRRRGGGPPR